MEIMHRIKMLTVMAVNETGRTLRSSKIYILGLYLIVVYSLVIEPLKNCSGLMDSKISYLEIFCSLNNSSVVFLVMPLAFMIIISDFPRDDGIGVFYQMRCSRSEWITGQLFFCIIVSILMIFFNLMASIVMIGSCGEFSVDFSYAVTHYVTVYPEKSRDYVVDLVPGRLYNQLKLTKAFWLSAGFVFLYFLILSTIQLFFYLINKKNIGILINVMLIGVGCILNSFETKLRWLFPMSHTIPSAHFQEYIREEIFPIYGSLLYLGAMYVLLIVACFAVRKKKQLF